MAVVLTSPRPSHGALNWDAIIEADLGEISTKFNYADQGIPGGDLNGIIRSGWYYGSSLTNAPGSSANGFIVLTMLRPDGTTGAQLAINAAADGQFYVRRRASGAWQAWKTVTTT